MNLKSITYFLVLSIAIVTILIYSQNLLIPIVFAILLWFTIRELNLILDKVKFIKLKFPSWLKSLITSSALIGFLAIISRIITASIKSLAKSYKIYETNADKLLTSLSDLLNLNLGEIIKGHLGTMDFGIILGSIFNSFTTIFSSTFMILLYALFIFLEEAHFKSKLEKMFSSSTTQYSKISLTIDQIEESVSKYLGLKTIVSLITGILSFLVLWLIGIDSPMFWAFLIFILNFIPTIGSLIATLFPALFCLLQFGEFMPGILVLVFVGSIQLIVGNFIEPKLMGNSMNISPLVTIIALSFWGSIWGVTGMILSIPITVIMVIVFSKFPSTKQISIFLSEKGEIL